MIQLIWDKEELPERDIKGSAYLLYRGKGELRPAGGSGADGGRAYPAAAG